MCLSSNTPFLKVDSGWEQLFKWYEDLPWEDLVQNEGCRAVFRLPAEEALKELMTLRRDFIVDGNQRSVITMTS